MYYVLMEILLIKSKIHLIKYTISKLETCLVEGYNAVLSYYLARLHCKTKCYSQAILILNIFVKLILACRGGGF